MTDEKRIAELERKLDEARAEVQTVSTLLVTRFGSQEEVFRHITKALALLKTSPKKAAKAASTKPARRRTATKHSEAPAKPSEGTATGTKTTT